MPLAPGFWRHGDSLLLPALLSPIGAIVAASTARRVAKPPAHSPLAAGIRPRGCR